MFGIIYLNKFTVWISNCILSVILFMILCIIVHHNYRMEMPRYSDGTETLGGYTLKKDYTADYDTTTWTLLDEAGKCVWTRSYDKEQASNRIITFYNRDYLENYVSRGINYYDEPREYINMKGETANNYFVFYRNHEQLILWIYLIAGIVFGTWFNANFMPKRYRMFPSWRTRKSD